MLLLACLLLLVSFTYPKENTVGPVKYMELDKFLGRFYHVSKCFNATRNINMNLLIT